MTTAGTRDCSRSGCPARSELRRVGIGQITLLRCRTCTYRPPPPGGVRSVLLRRRAVSYGCRLPRGMGPARAAGVMGRATGGLAAMAALLRWSPVGWRRDDGGSACRAAGGGVGLLRVGLAAGPMGCRAMTAVASAAGGPVGIGLGERPPPLATRGGARAARRRAGSADGRRPHAGDRRATGGDAGRRQIGSYFVLLPGRRRPAAVAAAGLPAGRHDGVGGLAVAPAERQLATGLGSFRCSPARATRWPPAYLSQSAGVLSLVRDGPLYPAATTARRSARRAHRPRQRLGSRRSGSVALSAGPADARCCASPGMAPGWCLSVERRRDQRNLGLGTSGDRNCGAGGFSANRPTSSAPPSGRSWRPGDAVSRRRRRPWCWHQHVNGRTSRSCAPRPTVQIRVLGLRASRAVSPRSPWPRSDGRGAGAFRASTAVKSTCLPHRLTARSHYGRPDRGRSP